MSPLATFHNEWSFWPNIDFGSMRLLTLWRLFGNLISVCMFFCLVGFDNVFIHLLFSGLPQLHTVEVITLLSLTSFLYICLLTCSFVVTLVLFRPCPMLQFVTSISLLILSYGSSVARFGSRKFQSRTIWHIDFLCGRGECDQQ